VRRAAALPIGAALALIALGARAEAQPSEAERLYQEGQEAYDEERYDAALAMWQRSYELSQRPALLFNVAQAYRLRDEAGDCARAVESYRRFLQLARDSPRRATAEGWVRELEACAKATPDEPSARRPTPTDAGAAPPEAAGAARAGSEAGQIRSQAPGRGASKRVVGVIVAGGGAAAALVGVYFGDRARGLGDEVSRACADGCAWSGLSARDAEGRSAERTQWILYGVGAGGLIAGAALYYLGARERSQAIAVAPRGGGGLLVWSRRW